VALLSAFAIDAILIGVLTVTKREQLAFLIAGTWILVTITAAITKDITVLTIVTPVMVLVTGFFFGKGNNNS